ncbi:MAG: hypothetical protein AAFY08_15530 [Planctomycetota bacterium]
MDRESWLPLGVGVVVAIVLHLAAAPLLAVRVFDPNADEPPAARRATTPPKQDPTDPDQPPPPPPEQRRVFLGSDDAEPLTTVAWLAYDDFQELVAPQARTLQPVVQTTVEPTPDAPPVVDATPPAPLRPEPPTPAQPTPPSPPTPPAVAAPNEATPSPPAPAEPVPATPLDQVTLAQAAPPLPPGAQAAPGIATPQRPGSLSDADPPDPTPTPVPGQADEPIDNPQPTDADRATNTELESDPDSLPDEPTDAPQPRATGQADAGLVDPQPRDDDDARTPADQAAPLDQPAGRPNDPTTDPSTADTAEPSPDATEPDDPSLATATPSPPPTPPTPPAPVAPPASESPARPTSAPLQEREVPPSQLTRVELDTPVRPGRVITGPGIQINTVVPRISTVARISTLPYGNPKYAVTFDTDGVVINVDPIRPAGPANWEGPIVNSLYNWTATGERLADQTRPFTIEFTLRLFGSTRDDDQDDASEKPNEQEDTGS